MRRQRPLSTRWRLAEQGWPILMLVTEPHPELARIVAQAVAGGVDWVQWRTSPPPIPLPSRKGGTEGMLSMGGSYLSPPSGTGGGRGVGSAKLIVNTRAIAPIPADTAIPSLPPLSLRRRGVGGEVPDGVHLPEAGPPASAVRTTLPADAIVGRSVHSIVAARAAEAEGADYLVAGTIFESPSHPGQPGAGIDFLRSVCEAVSIPVIAIGGITPENASECIDAGAAGVAVLSTIMRASDPETAAWAYRTAMGPTPPSGCPLAAPSHQAGKS